MPADWLKNPACDFQPESPNISGNLQPTREGPDWRGYGLLSAIRLNSSSLDLRPLYYFIHVAEEGSFSRAAAALSISQPVLSRQIKLMEEAMRVQLLYRNGRGVGLTEAGRKLYDHGVGILRGISQAHLELAALRGQASGNVSIAVPPFIGGMISAEIVRQLKRDHPLVSISLREGFTAETLDWLGSGAVDIGVLFNPPNIATLIVEHICDDRIHLVGTPGSLDLPLGTPIDASRLAELPLILPPAPHRLRNLIDAAGKRAGLKISAEIEVTGSNTILDLVRRRVGYTVLPSALLSEEIAEGRLASWPIEPEIDTHLFVATSMQKPQTMANKVVLQLMGKVLSGIASDARR